MKGQGGWSALGGTFRGGGGTKKFTKGFWQIWAEISGFQRKKKGHQKFSGIICKRILTYGMR